MTHEHPRAKSALARQIVRILDENGWDQATAAAKLGTHQPVISDLKRGRLQSITYDRLVNWLVSLGWSVEMKLDPSAKPNVSVAAANGDHGVAAAPPASDISRRMSSPQRGAFHRLIEDVGSVDQVGIEERVAKFQTRSIKKQSKLWGLTTAVSMVDLTTLEGKDTPGKVASLCAKARHPTDDPDVPPVAAVCIYPAHVKTAARLLADTPIKIASVATGFPAGQTPIKVRLVEVKQAVADGADEIDMVINRGAFLSGDFRKVQDEIASVVDACGDATLKVILEVSELESYDKIRAASFIAMHVIREGDFIKTSTGKASGSATLGNTQVMLEAIRDFYLATGKAIGMKPAGGIKNAKQALHYLVAVKETLGDAWLNSSRYRFGASSLLNDLLRQIEKEKTGAYQAPWYFTEAAESY